MAIFLVVECLKMNKKSPGPTLLSMEEEEADGCLVCCRVCLVSSWLPDLYDSFQLFNILAMINCYKCKLLKLKQERFSQSPQLVRSLEKPQLTGSLENVSWSDGVSFELEKEGVA